MCPSHVQGRQGGARGKSDLWGLLEAGMEGSEVPNRATSSPDLSRRRLAWLPLAAASALIGMSFIDSGPGPTQTDDGYKQAMTTLFWIGEPASQQNDFIPNHQSYWDEAWQKHYGGLDDPHDRNGYWPGAFKPKENPFYVALPYGEFVSDLVLKPEATQIPWYRLGRSPLLKNRWVEIRHGAETCFAQWEDVGPYEENDFDYVFGKNPKPRNRRDVKAGLDVSPAVWQCLQMRDNAVTAWRFVGAKSVPQGPWKKIVTRSGNNR